jgi:ribosomal protein L11 methyltransferase
MTFQPVSTYALTMSLPQQLRMKNAVVSRSQWVSEVSEYFLTKPDFQFQGALEGEALTSEKIYDAGLAPARRDLVRDQEKIISVFYFGSLKGAESAREEISKRLESAIEIKLEVVKGEDWNKKWRDSFQGVDIPPTWSIVPIWTPDREIPNGHQKILMNPSLGFGTGEHPTTQLCLEALGSLDLKNKRVLDFGSGSGILSVAAALKGAEVVSVEIDEMALQSARECAEINRVSERIQFLQFLPEDLDHLGKFDVVVANILKNILLEFAGTLTRLMNPISSLILSGLLEGDLAEVEAAYSELLGAKTPMNRGHIREWWCLNRPIVRTTKSG